MHGSCCTGAWKPDVRTGWSEHWQATAAPGLPSLQTQKAWLQAENITDWEPVNLAQPQSEEVVISVTATVDNLLVKEATGEGVGEAGVRARQMRQGKLPIVPGSSIKGVLRGQINRTVRCFAGVATTVVDEFLGRGAQNGDNGIAGKARFSDAIIQNSKIVVTSRNRIDRITGGTMDGALFSEETVAGNLSFEIRAPKYHPVGLSLLLFALRDMGLGLCDLGSGSNIGRGRVDHLQVEIRCADRFACLSCADGTVSVTDNDGLIASWNRALKEGGCQ